MGLLKGSGSFVRFSVEGELPENLLDYVASRVASFSFQDIDDTYDEYSIGWVSILNMFDSQFKYASYVAGDYITLTLRVDERKVSPAILKKVVQKEEERERLEKELPKLSRSMRVQIKERVRTELMRKAIPIPTTYELCWSLTDSTLLFFSTNKKAQALLEDYFKESFGLLIRQQIPYITAEHLLDEEQVAQLARITPEIFV
ncbi:recombination-associated protein RdgC [Desulforhopalus sp. IMCC35007]|uniref:recombination-associated protein RdgC n=1 Tax=Desulforhopalus sp. IMCC35007 TaxID=2569543 RepID=UPI0010AE5E84|nr:recombination-associated protein RdgC [Desulforhopalus sp. IMCC35007]TKB11634.1 DNA recombination-dependent growth factor C [Desulforhopalus sp. IMCC35007]